ncbi:hypothetical protein QFC19_000674 [Naganishia cerealis]|uniref:Uncharacterized protein n=1 Tax=Naganishia cerealis TaxID=610337 RepID=A0ACC2WN70_9TREE|nr:hypothetical protein QFC19_000674 [Naganishia cerealis]
MYPRNANTIFIPRILDQFDCLNALGVEQRQQRGRIRPEYATAVFVAYIRAKLSKGRTPHEVSLKLQDLERGLPHLSSSFIQARQIMALPPSPLFPPPRTDPFSAGGTSQLGLLRTQSAYHAGVQSSGTAQSPTIRRASTATSRPSVAPQVVHPAPATVRPVEESTEPPPPPYSRQDPEPAATAQLTRQLSHLTTGSATAPVPTAASPSSPPAQEATSSSAERERRELEEALRLSRESAEEEEAIRLSRESAEAEQARRLSAQQEIVDPIPFTNTQHNRAASPPPLPARSAAPHAFSPAASRPPVGTLAPPLSPIRTGSNNPFASALDADADSSDSLHEAEGARYAPPPGPPPGHISNHVVQSPFPLSGFVPPPGPPPGHASRSFNSSAANPFIDHNSVSASPSTSASAAATPPPADLAILAAYDTILLIDDSGSMAGDRWRQVRVALMDVAGKVARVDEDGVEVHFVNSMVEGYNLTTAGSVEKLFNKVKPSNGTPTGAALKRILEPYMDQLEHVQRLKAHGEPVPLGEDVKPVNVIVLTDGAATDDPESVIVSVASRLDRGGFPLNQVGIQFLQIGNECELPPTLHALHHMMADGLLSILLPKAEAREALQALDDGIKEKHEVRDIVDTVVYNGMAVSAEHILKVLLGGIHKHLDEREVPMRGEGFV